MGVGGNGAAPGGGSEEVGKVRVVVVDDQPLARAGCRLAVEGGEGLVVVGETDCRSALRAAIEQRPDVMVVQGRVPGVDALEVTRRIRADDRLGRTRVIVFAGAGWDVLDALRARACGVLSSDAHPDELRSAVRAVAEGGGFLAPVVARQVINEVSVWSGPSPRWRQRLAVLTEREQEVVTAVAHGLSNEAIGRRLHMSPATARTHVSRALTKLGLRDRPQLVVLAYEAGLIAPGADPDSHPIYDPPPPSIAS